MTSPNDPLFWLHHCYIDKLWAEWQEKNNNNKDMVQELTDENAIDTELDFPQPQDKVPIRSVLNYEGMGYKYQ